MKYARTKHGGGGSGGLFLFLVALVVVQVVQGGIDDTSLYNMDDLPMASGADFDLPKVTRCQALTPDVLSICDNLSYNKTQFPNFMLQNNQREAAQQLALYAPLLKLNCSKYYKLFMCTMFVPPCVENGTATDMTIMPCREMCLAVKSGCETFMKQFSFNWPTHIDCWKMVSHADTSRACIHYDDYNSFLEQQQAAEMQTKAGGLNALLPMSPKTLLDNLNSQQKQTLIDKLNGGGHGGGLPNKPPSFSNENVYQFYTALLAAAAAAAPDSEAAAAAARIRVKFVCPPSLQVLEAAKNAYYLKVNEEVVKNCAMPCENNIFAKAEITFARSWVLVWSTICFLSTLFTILTFSIEPSRFRYPERPIIFLSACYLIVSLAYMIGSSALSSSNSLVCRPQKNGLGESKDFVVQGVEHIPCTLLFMMIYFFGMAASVWWIVLTLTWFLAAGLKWSHEAIENIASYFHLLAWAIPGVKMIAILWLQNVDADILSGICYTGIRNVNVMRGFVLAPSILYLILGTCFLLAGFVSLFRIRNIMKLEGNKTEKLERFMIRIGVFSILYIVPAIVVVGCYFYEVGAYSKWIDYWLRHNRIEFNLPLDFVENSLFEQDRSALVFSVFYVKYTMILVVGITSGFWIWSPKTITSWRKFLAKIVAVLGHLQPKYKNEATV